MKSIPKPEEPKMTDISDHLKAALSDVKDAQIPEVLMPLAFEEALRLRGGKPGTQPKDPSGSGSRDSKGEQPSVDGDLSDIATRFGVDLNAINEVFVQKDGEIHLAIGSKAIASGKATGAKEIALLVAGARQAIGSEDWTSVNAIRDECKHYGRYDASNYGSTITEMENLFQFTGKGQGREVKMRQPAWEEAGELVRRLVGGE
jgi:hypothetical protein